MYGNYPTGYSYVAISISGRPDMDGRAVWEEGKDTAADKKPRFLFFYVDGLATGSDSFSPLCFSLSYIRIYNIRWKSEQLDVHKHSQTDNAPVIANAGKIKKGKCWISGKQMISDSYSVLILHFSL